MIFVIVGGLIGLWLVGNPVTLDTAVIVLTIALTGEMLGASIRKRSRTDA